MNDQKIAVNGNGMFLQIKHASVVYVLTWICIGTAIIMEKLLLIGVEAVKHIIQNKIIKKE